MNKSSFYCPILFLFLLFYCGTYSFSQSKSNFVLKVFNEQESKFECLIKINNQGAKKYLCNTFYHIPVEQSSINLNIHALGKQAVDTILNVSLIKMDTIILKLKEKIYETGIVTVSASKYDKKVEEEVVSVEILKANSMHRALVNSINDGLNRVPGVDVIENQINIRGGAGWSYGAGSRVLVLLDGMPMLSADANDVKWGFLPVENCNQIEIIKGAGSALYGSSALNGVVNLRTNYATHMPKTSLSYNAGIYQLPKENYNIKPDSLNKGFMSFYFTHSQKFANMDLVLGGNLYSETSYLSGQNEQRARLNGNLRFTNFLKKGFVYGLNFNIQPIQSTSFLFWQTKNDSAVFNLPFGGFDTPQTTLNTSANIKYYLDPYVEFTSKNGLKHILRNRFFHINNLNSLQNQTSLADLFYSEYMLQKTFTHHENWLKTAHINFGLVQNLMNVSGNLYGSHKVKNYASFLQFDQRYKRLGYSIGIRFEANKTDAEKIESKLVSRFGLNYKLAKSTFLRMSYGEGYRYPSIAERFVKTNFGATNVFPNPELKSETGWTSELGVKQLFQLGEWKGILDVSAFYMRYKDMMEFNFRLFLPADSTINQIGLSRLMHYIGFKSLNVGESEIFGSEIVLATEGKINRILTKIILGYTNMHPTYINPDSAIMVNLSGDENWLKYRNKHTLKFESNFTLGKWGVDFAALYNSFMMNIDEVFANTKPDLNLFGTMFNNGTGGLSNSIEDFRNKQKKGNLVIDFRLNYSLDKHWQFAFVLKNAFNTLYIQRPALISPPRTYNIKIDYIF